MMTSRHCNPEIWLPALAVATTLSVATPGRAAPTEPGGLTNPIAPSTDCRMCHTFDNAKIHPDEPLYAPFPTWQGGLMANAARDPIFWAGVAVADQDHPGETIDCVRCHAPRAFLDGRGTVTEISELLPDDFDGVACEVCHRMVDDSPEPRGNARYRLDDTPVNGVVPRRGPWDDYVDPDTPPHAWIADPFTGSSELCGTCHDVSTARPRLDDDGRQIAPQFNEQRTYSEWANSSFAIDGAGFASCQDCHMPPVDDMAACAAFINVTSHAEGGRRHDLVGANRFMLELLRQEYGDNGTRELFDFYFDLAIERTDALLATAATVEIAGPASVDLVEGLTDLTVTVTNNSGHKLPSGYSEGRVMWLEVQARYGEETIWSSGAFEPGVGPTQDAQLRTYQGIAEELASGTSLHLLLNDHWVQDTRIPPLGLRADLQTDPVGDRYVVRGDGTWPNFDVAPYSFEGAPDVVDATPDDASDDALTVHARLWYLINTPAYVQFLADENTTNEAGSDVAMLFDTAGGAPPMMLAEATLAIPIVGFGAQPGSSSDTTAASGPGLDSTGPEQTGSGRTDSTEGADTTTSSSGTGTDGGGTDDDGGSCACTATPRRPQAWWLLLPLVVGPLRSRRERGSPRPRRA